MSFLEFAIKSDQLETVMYRMNIKLLNNNKISYEDGQFTNDINYTICIMNLSCDLLIANHNLLKLELSFKS